MIGVRPLVGAFRFTLIACGEGSDPIVPRRVIGVRPLVRAFRFTLIAFGEGSDPFFPGGSRNTASASRLHGVEPAFPGQRLRDDAVDVVMFWHPTEGLADLGRGRDDGWRIARPAR